LTDQWQRPLHYVAIGDSLTVGIGSDLFHPSFVGYYADLASRALERPVFTDKFARSGATTAEIFNVLYLPAISESLRTSDLVTLTAGGNDLIDAAQAFLLDGNEARLLSASERAIAHIKKIIERIHFLHNPEHHCYAIRLLNLYNPFPSIPQADTWIQSFNRHLNEYARYPHIKIADIYSAFQGRQNALLHGIHPNDRGYEVMAEVLDSLGYAPLKH